MNILPVSFINFNPRTNNNKVQASRYSFAKNTFQSSKVFACDTVTFTSVPNSEVLKRLLSYQIPDMYSDRILLDPRFVQKVMRNRLFTKPIRTICRVLKPHEKSLFPVEKKVFDILCNIARRKPKAKLDEVIHKLVPEHNKKLLQLQMPIFEELNILSKSMPEDLRKEFDNLYVITNHKLLNNPVIKPFSLREFKYKLGRIQERINKTNKGKDPYTMKKIMTRVNSLPVYSKERIQSPSFSKKKYERRLKAMLSDLSIYIDGSSLSDNKDLRDLIMTSKSQFFGIPTNIKFNRKSFIYDLKKITDKLQDKKLAHRMVQTAIQLPTSKENLSAFIMKSADRSSEQIGYDLLLGSLGTADHLVAAKKGGADDLFNYGLASAYMNSVKAHMDFKEFLKKNPQIAVYCQRQVDRLIELANAGIFSKIGLTTSYINTFASKIHKLSPKENPLNLDISKLKY